MTLSRRRLCGGALAVVGGIAGTALIAGCSDGGDDASPDDASAPHDDASPDDAASATANDQSGQGDRPVMYSSPTCGCCAEYAPYLRDNGYDVEVRQDQDLDEVKRRAGIPAEAESCHTTLIDGYAVEGHVPVEAIAQLLRDRPPVDAIALPGMPAGSPGMSGTKTAPFEIVSITAGTIEPYMSV